MYQSISRLIYFFNMDYQLFFCAILSLKGDRDDADNNVSKQRTFT